ncbi:probable leucine--tRNA ligase, mitochondrial isoform X2 [Pararge aegeria]|uniref:probable leucine--tRNA ligase, mitochondrial isoform X2 n=1 Tax=Pararge aegeria TaxID=116150 RepID=UPI0019D01226|nr:probable leucine--tRNA ligase, mitochondrial isoform X2 [Pararge aegeria]
MFSYRILKIVVRRPTVFSRYKSSLGLWNHDITTNIKLDIEKYWAKEILCNKIGNKDTYYVLPMFPYPSGNLHMGHVRVYSISDTIARFQELEGKNVIHPIGWDAFGLPAENAAIERNTLPHIWTDTNISAMKEQLVQLGFKFDWNREISTCDPKYYKWTQYIFLKLFENGLAYQCKAKVNWDPIDQTVLADEQVDDSGCSWRSGVKVEEKILTQWFIKTTKYAKHLYEGLNSKSLDNWKDIINLQKHWIGECNVFVADNINYPEGRDVYIACPSIDSEDYKLCLSLNIPIAKTNDKIVDKISENERAIDLAQKNNCGGYFVSSKLKDWLISRQRFWGTPIPIIHCPNCGIVPVPYEDLPVVLPEISTQETRVSKLTSFKSWQNCKCPKCSSDATRESDTMDTFVDSSWYYYRFLDPNNDKKPFDKEKLMGVTPVNCYIGGKEHAVLHLYYTRFMSYFLHSLGLTPTQEPFKKLLVQGMIMGQSYKTKNTGKYLPPENVEKIGNEYKERETGEPVLVQWEKMSKSKYNGENPERLLSTYGCDTTRLLILADVPPATSRRWSDTTLPGVLNFQHRLWITIRDFLMHKQNVELSTKNILSEKEFKEYENKLWNSRNYFIATATYHFKYTHKLSVGISRLQSLTNVLRNNIPPQIIANSKEYEKSLASLIIMLSIITPHFGCELWAGMRSAPNRICDNADGIDWNQEVVQQRWPIVDESYPLSLQCKVDGADRCDLKIEANKLNSLDLDRVLQIVIEEKGVAERIKHGILRTKYELYPNCRAILHIFTNRKAKNKLQLEKEKETFSSQA